MSLGGRYIQNIHCFGSLWTLMGTAKLDSGREEYIRWNEYISDVHSAVSNTISLGKTSCQTFGSVTTCNNCRRTTNDGHYQWLSFVDFLAACALRGTEETQFVMDGQWVTH